MSNDRDHPVFGRLQNGPLGAIESITERRIRQARVDGLFDDLPGTGKPIADLATPRRPGWFADRIVTTERNKLKAIRLEDEIRDAMPALWRLPHADAVRERVGQLNESIDGHNRHTTLEPLPKLDLHGTLRTWRRLRR